MDKKTDAARRPRNAGRRNSSERSAFSRFEWDAVDNQTQEDLIEPVAVAKKRAKSSPRRDKEVGTMFVSNSESDVFVPTKKKPVKTLHAEDYAEFVAEVGEDEEDPYAIPSYGQTRLTHSDEELVEEMATPKESKLDERKRRPSNDDDKTNDDKTNDRENARSGRRGRRNGDQRDKNDAASDANGAKAKNARESEPVDAARANVGKRSFLSKIKEAISTGAVSRADAPAPSAEQVGALRLPQKTMQRLAQATARVAKVAGLDAENDSERASASQFETLANLVETLLEASDALIARLDEKERSVAAPEAKSAVRSPARDANNCDAASRNAKARAAQPKQQEESRDATDAQKETDAARKDRVESRSKTPPLSVPLDPDDDDYDPIAAWENMPDDDDAPVALESPRETEQSDFDDWDEAESKKKSARDRKGSQARSVFKEAPKVAARESRNAREERDAPKRAELSETKPLERFGDLVLKKATLKALQQMGYVEPTPIQAGTIPTTQKGVDVLGQAKTGTGKTAAFMIPIVEGVSECEPSREPLALVVVPTRELAVQARDETVKLARYYDLSVAACYGGKPIASQVEKLRAGVDILVGTPGRIIDLANRGALSLGKARWVVLDEADRMLDEGFRPDVERILRMTPRTRQTLLFSATLPPSVVRLAKTYMKEPEQFDFSLSDVAADTIEQFYITVDQDRKFDALSKLLEIQHPRQAIVFCRTKRHVDALGRRLAEKFPNVEAIHGDLPQTKRDRIMRDFRAEKTKILVATDVVGRGIDVSSVSHIVNYDVPQYCDDYVHRVGRAGRMGREGVAFTLVTAEEGAELTRIEVRINRLLERCVLPDFEACAKPQENAEEATRERKPVFGQSRRRVRRAL